MGGMALRHRKRGSASDSKRRSGHRENEAAALAADDFEQSGGGDRQGTVQSSASRRCFGASGHPRHGPVSSRPMRTYGIFRASIPSFFIRVSRVVRFRPKRAAAPFGPPTCPLVSFRIRTIVFCSSEFLAVAGADLAPLFANSGTEMAKVLLRVRITARSTRF